MKKNTMFPNLLQTFLSDDELKKITDFIGFKDKARKLTVRVLIEYMLTAATCEWKGLRHSGDVGAAAGLGYSALSKKLKELDYSLMNVSAETIAGMYKERWGIESFFRWIKQNLNVPVLFSTTKNAVFSQLFGALIAYVLLKWLYKKAESSIYRPSLSLAGFQRLLLWDAPPLEWQAAVAEYLYMRKQLNGISLSHFG